MKSRQFAIIVSNLILVSALLSTAAHAADPLDRKYPNLAKLRVPSSALPASVKSHEMRLPPPHERLEPFRITEDRASFGVNRTLLQVLMLDRIKASYIGTYQLQQDGGPFSFSVQAWEYTDEKSAKANAAEFAEVTASSIENDIDDPAAATAAAASMKFLHDGTLVIYLAIDSRAPDRTRTDFEKLIRSRLSSAATEVLLNVESLPTGNRSSSGKPQPPDEQSDEMKRQLASIQQKWQKEFRSAKSPRQQTALARKLIGEANKPNTESNNRAALLLSAAMQAIEAHDVDTSVMVADAFGQHFAYDTEEGRVQLASMACERRATQLPSNSLNTVLKLCASAIDQKEFYSAKLLLNAAMRTKDDRTQTATQALQTRILAEQSDEDRDNDPGDDVDGPMVVREVARAEMKAPVNQKVKSKPKQKRKTQGKAADNPFVRANGELIELPAKFQDVIVGGSGRFLFFLMGDLKKLAVFDVQEREITHELPLEEADSRIAAGAEHIYITVRRENVIQRWSLDSFEKELTVKLPFQSPVEEIATGSHVTGVIYAGSTDKNGVLLSPKTLKSANLKIIDHTGRKPADPLPGAEKVIVRASPNGRTFCLLSTRYSPGDFRTLVVIDKYVHSFRRGESVSYMTPDFEGELIFTPKGIFTDQSKEFRLSDGLRAERFQLPAVGGHYSVSVNRDDRSKKENATVNIHVGSAAEPILSIPDITVRPGSYGDFHAQNRLTLDRRVLFFADAKLLVTLPKSDDTLVLTDLDIDEELDQLGEDYLFVVSRPPQYVKTGRRFVYQMEVKSSKGGVTYELDSGPSGMRVTDEGSVSWRVPRKAGEPADAVITVSDDSGRETTHAFRLISIN